MLKIVVDTREQAPFAFRHEKMEATTEPGTLAGLEDKIAVERKSLPDLVLCLGRERERFERELARGAALDAFAKEGGKLTAGLTASTIKKGEVQLSPHAGARRRAVWRKGCRRVGACNHKKRDSGCSILSSLLAGGTGKEAPAKEKAPVGGLDYGWTAGVFSPASP